MEAGCQHLWEFDLSQENKLATINAGPPQKQTDKSKTRRQAARRLSKRRRASSAAAETEAEDEDEEGPSADAQQQLEASELIWWDYGLGPRSTEWQQPQAAASKKQGKKGRSKVCKAVSEQSAGAGGNAQEAGSDQEQDDSNALGGRPRCLLMYIHESDALSQSLSANAAHTLL